MHIPLRFDGNEVVQATETPDIFVTTERVKDDYRLTISCNQHTIDGDHIRVTILMEADAEADGYYTAERSSILVTRAYPYISFSVSNISNIRIYTKEILEVFGKTEVEALRVDVLTAVYHNMYSIYQSVIRKATDDLERLDAVLP